MKLLYNILNTLKNQDYILFRSILQKKKKKYNKIMMFKKLFLVKMKLY